MKSKNYLHESCFNIPAILICAVFLLTFGISGRLFADGWEEFDGYKQYSVPMYQVSFDVSASSKYLYYIDFFRNPDDHYDSGWRLNKIDFNTGKLIYRDTMRDHGNENYCYWGVRECADGKSYCLTYSEMNYDNYDMFVNLRARIYDFRTDSIIADIKVDSIHQLLPSGFPSLYSMSADYSSSDSMLAFSSTYIRYDQYGKKILPIPYSQFGRTFSNYQLVKLTKSNAGKLIPQHSISPKIKGSTFIRRSQPDLTLLYEYYKSSTYIRFDDPYTDDRYNCSLSTSFYLVNNADSSYLGLNYNSFSTNREEAESNFKGYLQTMTMSGDQSKFAFSKLDSNLYFGNFSISNTALDTMKLNTSALSTLLSHDGRFALVITDRALLLDLRNKAVLDTLQLPTYPILLAGSPYGTFERGNFGWIVCGKSSCFVKFHLPIFDSTSYFTGLYSSAHLAFCGDTIKMLAYSNREPDSIKWDFADGTSDSLATVSKVYSSPGEYLPRFNVTHGKLKQEIVAKRPIIIIEKPIASFTVDKQSGDFPLTVRFENQSSGRYSGCKWDFGDDSTSTEANPTHTYLHPGTYSPRLVLTTPEGLELSSAVSIAINASRKKVQSIELISEYANMKGRYAWTEKRSNGNFVSKLFSPELVNSEEFLSQYSLKCSSFSIVDTANVLKSYYADPKCITSPCYLQNDTLYFSCVDVPRRQDIEDVYMIGKLGLANSFYDSTELRNSFSGDFFGVLQSAEGKRFWLGFTCYDDLPLLSRVNVFKAENLLIKIDGLSRISSTEPFVFDDRNYTDVTAGDLIRTIQTYSPIGRNAFSVMNFDGETISSTQISTDTNFRFCSIAPAGNGLSFVAGQNDATGCFYLLTVDDAGRAISVDSAQGFKLQRLVSLEKNCCAFVGSSDGLISIGIGAPDGKIKKIYRLNDRPGNVYHAKYEGDGKLLISGYLDEGVETAYIAEVVIDLGFLGAESGRQTANDFRMEIAPQPVVDYPFVRFYGADSPVSIVLTDMLGRTIFEKTYGSALDGGSIAIPVLLDRGVYFLTARSGSNSTSAKFIKE